MQGFRGLGFRCLGIRRLGFPIRGFGGYRARGMVYMVWCFGVRFSEVCVLRGWDNRSYGV